jgi:hypothetical protein
MTNRKMFHTQEGRSTVLKAPIICERDDAWLGVAYYFWKDLADAEMWGNTSKRKTGYYDIYEGLINCNNILDTVFNEEHYNFWLRQIEKVATNIIKKTGLKPTIKELNDYLKERGSWNKVDGIMFQDLPTNNNFLLVEPIKYKYKSVSFAYRKRIQLAIYNPETIITFARLKREEVI